MSSTLQHLIYLLLLCAHALPAQSIIYRDKLGRRVDSTAEHLSFEQLSPLDSGLTYVKEYSVGYGLQRAGAWLGYDPDSVRNATPVGVHYFYHLIGTLWYTRAYREGKTQELRSYYPEGQLKRIEHYEGDKLLSGKCFRPDSTEMAFVAFERAPAFRGGEQALMQYLAGNIFYPKKARKKGVQGSVVVQFVVEKSGKISSVEAVQRIGGGCDEEAVRVVSEMPDWSPGYMDDRPVKVRFTLPIRFRLE